MTAVVHAGLRLRRQLTDAERVVDIAAINAALEDAKDRLAQAVAAEQRRAVRRLARGGRPTMRVTGAMLAVLRQLAREGRRHAARELDQLASGRRLAAGDAPGASGYLRDIARSLESLVHAHGVRLGQQAATLELTGLAADAIRRRLLDIAGARDIASRVVSGAFTAGLAATYEQAAAAGLIGGWQYSAILDPHTCDVCGPLDGKTYRTLEEAYQDLPGFGPNPRCRGDGRCRCRLVPIGPAGTAAPAAPALEDVDAVAQRVILARSSRGGYDGTQVWRDVTRAVSGLHGIPVGAPTITVTSLAPLGKNVLGGLGVRNGVPEFLAVNLRMHATADDLAATMIHELGHYVDDGALRMLVRTRLTGDEGPSWHADELQAWRTAVENTSTIRRLRSLRERARSSVEIEYLEYLLRPDEMWARSYQQWVAWRTGLGRRAIDIDLRNTRPQFVPWEEFGPVAAEIEDVLRRAGLLRSPSRDFAAPVERYARRMAESTPSEEQRDRAQEAAYQMVREGKPPETVLEYLVDNGWSYLDALHILAAFGALGENIKP